MKKLLFVSALLLSFLTTYASDIVWTGGTSTSWHTSTNWQGGVAPNSNDTAVFNGTSIVNSIITSNISVGGIRIETGYTGTITQSGATVTVGTFGFIQSSGTFVGDSSVITINGYFTINNGNFVSTSGTLTLSGYEATVTGGTFNHNNGTVYKTGGSAIWNFNQPIKNLVINTQGNFTTTSLHVLGNIDAIGWNVHIGTMEVEGDYKTYFVSQSTSTGKVAFMGSNNQLLDTNNGSGCISGVEVNKTGGVLTVQDTILVRTDWTNISSGANVDVSTAEIKFIYENDVTSNGMVFGNVTVSCPGWFNAVDKMQIAGLAKFSSFNTVNGLMEVSGNVLLTGTSQSTSTAVLKFVGTNNQTLGANGTSGVFANILVQKSGGSLTVSDTIKLTQGLKWISGTVNTSGSTFVFYGGSQTIDAEGINFNNVQLNSQGSIILARPLQVDGDFTVTGINLIEGERVEVKGNYSSTNTFFWGSGVETYLLGSNNQTVNLAGTIGLRKSIFINKTGGIVSLTANLNLSDGLQNINVISGTLDLNGFNLNLGGTLKNSGLIQLIGSEAVTLSGLDNSGQGTVTYYGTGTYSALALGDDYYHLSVAGNVTQDYQLSVLGNLDISGALNSNGYNLYLAGDFNNFGTYTSGANSIYLIGKHQTIIGSNSFNNLIKRNNTSASLTFPAGSTQTISGTLELDGTVGDLLVLKSSASGSTWTINHTGTLNYLSYLNVSDSTSVSVLDAKSNSVNGGNNTNWVFTANNALVWTGAVNNNFSNSGNWVGSIAPTAKDIIEFLSGSSAVSIDIDANVAGVVLGSGFSGSVTLATNKTLSVGFNGITISGGSLVGNTMKITSSGDLSISNGLFNSVASDVEIIGSVQLSGGTLKSSSYSFKVGGNWSKTGGTFDALGSVTFNGFGGQTILAGGTDSGSDFADVNVSFGTVTVSSALKVNGNLTINSGQLKSNATIQLAVNLSNNGGFINDQSNALWVLNGTVAQTVKLQNHILKDIQISNIANKVTFLDELNANELKGEAGVSIFIEKGKFVVVSKLTLNGTSAQPISFKSNIVQQNAHVVVSGVQTLSYVDVRGIDGQYGPTLNGTNNCVDLGYNLNWSFPNNSGKPVVSFTPTSDVFENAVTITIASTGASPVIYYTLNGSTPTTASTVYSAPLNLTATTTIKAISVDGVNTSIIFGKVYEAVQSAIDDGLIYPVKSYGLNALIYLGDVRRFEGEAWHVGADNLMNTLDDYRVPEFDKYIVWSCTGGTITKIVNTGGAIFKDDGYTSAYTVTLTLGPKSFTGCNNCTPIVECEGEKCVVKECLPDNSNRHCPNPVETSPLTPPNSSPTTVPAAISALPAFGEEDNSPFSVLRNAGAYNAQPFGLGLTGRLSGMAEVEEISQLRAIYQTNETGTGGGFPFDKNSNGVYFRDGGNPGFMERIVGSNSSTQGFKFTAPNGTVSIFEKPISSNKFLITRKTDAFGNLTTFDYQSASFLVVTDPSGNKTEITANYIVNGVNQITQIVTKPFGSILSKTWSFNYDSNGFLSSQKFENSQTAFGYGECKFATDIHGNPIMFEDYKGNQYINEHDDVWRITKTTLPTGDVSTQSYSGKNGAYTVTKTDPLGEVTTTFRNQNPYHIQTTKVITADGLITEYLFDAKGFIVQMKQKPTANIADDIVTLYEYDSFHYLTKETVDPSGLNLITSYEWDSKGNNTKKIDPNGVVTQYTYTPQNRLASKTEDLGGLNITTSFSYDLVGNKISRTDPLGKIKTYQYDTFGNLIKEIDELSFFTTQTFNAFGNRISYTDKNGNISTFNFDVLNRMTQATDAAGFSEYFEYDGNNNLTRYTDQLNEVTVKIYNSLNYITLIGGDASAPGGCGVCGAARDNGQEGSYVPNWHGDVTQFTDANYLETGGVSGSITVYEFDSMYRNTLTVVDPFGLALATENTFDKLGRLTKTTKINNTGDDVITTYDFDKNSRVVANHQVLGLTTLNTQFEFDKMRHITKVTDPNGNFSTKEYDKLYRVIKTTDAENLDTTFAYNARSELTATIANPLGFAITTSYLYNDRRELIQTTQPDSGIETCEYDPNGNKTKCTDPMGGIRLWAFDNRNLMIKATDEANFDTNYTYNGLRAPLTMTNAQGTITSYTYAEKSFLVKVIEDVGGINRTTAFTRDEYGLLLNTIDPSGTVYSTVYDRAYRVVQQIADVGGKNVTTSTVFDSISRVIKTIDAASFETNYFYDQVNRLTKQTLPDGGEKTFTYDNLPNVLTAISKVTATQNYIVSYEYNKIYQVKKMIEDVSGINITTQKTYDALHRLSSIIDAKTQTTSYEYDSENRLTKETYADAGFISRTYDVDGRLTSKTDQSNDVCNYSYEARDLLIQQTYGGLGVKSFAFDSLGRKISESDNNSAQLLVSSSYTFDNLHRHLTCTQQIGLGTPLIDTKVYNAYGEVTQCTLVSGRVINYTYTALHQMDAIVSNVGNGIETLANYDYNYDTVNADMRPLVKKKTLATGTGIHTNFLYDELGRQVLNDSKNTVNTTVVGFEYDYNLIGNRLSDNHLHKADESETYSYDTAQRFTNYQRGVIGNTPIFTQGYTLDALANWTSFNNNGSTQNRTHDATNAITSLDSQAINNDAKGNQLNKDGKNYFWDKLNRLIEIRNSSNIQIAAYYYNTDNLRVEKITLAGTEQYYYCGARVCVETNGTQTVTKEYIHGGQYIDEIITVITGGDPYYYLYDLRFNMYAMVDGLANILERARYEGYGKQELMDDSFALIGSPLVDQPYSYTGQRLDTESGLQYYRARYFDNDMGRFLNRDPIGYVDGSNLYRGYFVNGGVDPFGLEDEVTLNSNQLGVSEYRTGSPYHQLTSGYDLVIPETIRTDDIPEGSNFPIRPSVDLLEDPNVYDPKKVGRSLIRERIGGGYTYISSNAIYSPWAKISCRDVECGSTTSWSCFPFTYPKYQRICKYQRNVSGIFHVFHVAHYRTQNVITGYSFSTVINYLVSQNITNSIETKFVVGKCAENPVEPVGP